MPVLGIHTFGRSFTPCWGAARLWRPQRKRRIPHGGVTLLNTQKTDMNNQSSAAGIFQSKNLLQYSPHKFTLKNTILCNICTDKRLCCVWMHFHLITQWTGDPIRQRCFTPMCIMMVIYQILQWNQLDTFIFFRMSFEFKNFPLTSISTLKELCRLIKRMTD